MIMFRNGLVWLLLMTSMGNSAAQQSTSQTASQTTPPLAAQTTVPASQVVEPDIVWLDVRSWAEYQLDHIDGDNRINHTEIVAKVTELFPDKSTPIRLYCASGGRAGNAAVSLTAAGYTNIENVGGIDQARRARFGEAATAPAVAD